MYSKSKGITDRGEARSRRSALTPPPGYDGSRFRLRSDGRDDAFPLYGDSETRLYEPPAKEEVESEWECDECAITEQYPKESEPPRSHLPSFLSGIGKEELLIIALIIILAGEREHVDADTLLLLGLLLCAG